VLGGTQSLHTNGYDEALALPTEQAATLALRTQQVIAYESGAALTADPLGGSYYVEHLTSELEQQALMLLARVDDLGGAAKAIAAGFFQEEIARSAYEFQLRVERGETVVVGVNRFSDGREPPEVPTPDYSTLEREQIARVRQARARRDNDAVAASLARLRSDASCYGDVRSGARPELMPLIVDAVRRRATVGEIASTLADVWGKYQPR
jgi:methylmalonyl-CoA mutase N-terminal domain/subunit